MSKQKAALYARPFDFQEPDLNDTRIVVTAMAGKTSDVTTWNKPVPGWGAEPTPDNEHILSGADAYR
jgi:hypothetical protein